MIRNLSNSTWLQVLTGAGTITIDAAGRKADLVASGGDTAYLRRIIPCQAGDVIECRVLAKMNSGTAQMIFDGGAPASPVTSVDFEAGALREYHCAWIVPQQQVFPYDMLVNIGCFTADTGDVTIFDPVIKVNGLDIDGRGIYEAGSGVNGDYTMFSDGTMICRKQITITDCTTAFGSVFSSGLVSAAGFQNESEMIAASKRYWFSCDEGPSGASAWVYQSGATVGVARGTSLAGDFTVNCELHGRWKE